MVCPYFTYEDDGRCTRGSSALFLGMRIEEYCKRDFQLCSRFQNIPRPIKKRISIGGNAKGEYVPGVGYVIKELKVEEISTMLTGLIDGDASIMLDPGYVLFCTKSGQVVRLKAKLLGDGIKRVIDFFKDLKKELNSPILETYAIEELLRKHGIDLSGV